MSTVIASPWPAPSAVHAPGGAQSLRRTPFSFKRLLSFPRKPQKAQTPEPPFKTWSSFNRAYQAGDVSFEAPVQPPFPLGEGEQFVAPPPLHERMRQRSIDALRLTTKGRALNFTAERPPLSPTGERPAKAAKPRRKQRQPIVDEQAPYRAELQAIVEKARQTFKTSVSVISIAENSLHTFLAESGFSAATAIERGSSPCTHSTVKASTGDSSPFVINDLALDWRFQNGNFGSSRFYASNAIMASAPYGSENKRFPIGVLCILDNDPRPFSAEDRIKLAELAKRAEYAIEDWRLESQTTRDGQLEMSRDDWRSSEIVRNAQNAPSSLATELPSPNPYTSGLQIDSSTMRAVPAPFAPGKASSTLRSTNVRPVTKYPATSAGSNIRRNSIRPRGPDSSIKPGVISVFGLSCSLISETLELSFTYVVAVDILTMDISILASHNMPIPLPVFDIASHVSVATSESGMILFTDSETSRDEVSTGVLVRIGIKGTVAYLLGSYADDTSRVIGRQEADFISSHAGDLSPLLELIEAV